MSFEKVLKIGQIINNDTLVSIFKCNKQKGIRPALKTNTIVVVCNHTRNIYNDRWENDVLHYTGQGFIGNQMISRENKSLYEAELNGMEIHLFEVFKKKEYTYVGVVERIGETYEERNIDENGDERNVIIFPLKRIDNEEYIVSSEIISEEFDKKTKSLRKLSISELETSAKLSSQNKPNKRLVKSESYDRSPAIAEYAKYVAKGKCELCEEDAPFFDKNGNPYLEAHHIIWLAEGGSDTLDNVVALCPNCHRRMHYLNLQKDVGYLMSKKMKSK